MNNQNRKLFPFRLTLKHLLIISYGLMVIVLLCVLKFEYSKNQAPLVLSSAHSTADAGDNLLALSGDGFSKNVRGLYSGSFVEEPEYLWSLLSGTSVNSVDVMGELALVSCFQNKLVSINVKDPTKPEFVDSLDFPKRIKFVKILQDMVFVGMVDNGGIAVLALGNEGSLEIVEILPTKGKIIDLVAEEPYVYYLDHRQGVGTLTLQADRFVTSLLVEMEKPWAFTYYQGKMVVAGIDGDLSFFDVMPDGQLEKVVQFFLEGAERGGVRGIQLTPGTLSVVLRGKRLKTFSTKEWPMLLPVADMELPGEPYYLASDSDMKKLLVSFVGGGLASVDISDSAQPFVESHILSPATFLELDVNDNVVYMAGMEGIHALAKEELKNKFYVPDEVINEAFRFLVSWQGRLYGYSREKTLVDLNMEGVASFASSDHYLFVNGNNSADYYRLDDDAQPLKLGAIATPPNLRQAWHEAGKWLMLQDQELTIFKSSTAEELLPIANLGISGQPHCIKLLNTDVLLVATRDEGLKLYDIADPFSPVLMSEVEFPEHLNARTIPRHISVIDGYAYVSKGTGGIYVVNINQLEKPRLVKVIATQGRARKMTHHDGVLYVANGRQGVFLVDVTDSSNPVPIGSIPTPVSVNDVAISENAIIVNGYPVGVVKLPKLQKLKDLVFVTDKQVRGRITEAADKGYAFVYDNFSNARIALKN